jgi:hypothetical protein
MAVGHSTSGKADKCCNRLGIGCGAEAAVAQRFVVVAQAGGDCVVLDALACFAYYRNFARKLGGSQL